MRRPRLPLGALALLAAGALAGAAAPAALAAPDWVKEPDPAPPAFAQTMAVGEGSFGRTAPGASRLLVTFEDRVGPRVARQRLDGLGTVAAVLPEAGVWRLQPAVDDRADARTAALARTGVASAEWSLARTSAVRERPREPTALPLVEGFTDPLFTPELQWGLLRGPAWSPELTGLNPRPRIAILDSGVDGTHEEWAGPDSPLVAPYSSITRSGEAEDWNISGHGTHVAGIAAAPANGVGVVGVAPGRSAGAQVIPVQIADAHGISTDDTMIRGICWAVTRGARIVSISSGGAGFSRAFQDTILWAAKRGALIVAAVGNEGDGLNTLNYPAAYARVLGVGALCDDEIDDDCPRPFGVARFSNFNRSVDLLAPGVNVVSSVPLDVGGRVVAPGYAMKDGTSMATPYVAGVAALAQASNGNALSPHQLTRLLLNTATDLGPRGYDVRHGAGAVNPVAAVTRRAPADDADEVNDDIKWLGGKSMAAERDRRQRIEASIDRREDRNDVVPVILRRGEKVRITLTHPRADLKLYLWRPGSRTVNPRSVAQARRDIVRFDGRGGRKKVVVYRAARTGRHYVNIFAERGQTSYELTVARGG